MEEAHSRALPRAAQVVVSALVRYRPLESRRFRAADTAADRRAEEKIVKAQKIARIVAHRATIESEEGDSVLTTALVN